MVTMRMSSMPMPCSPSIDCERMAAVAADTGEQVMPNDAVTVATLNGRSGRTLFFWAISEMMGNSA